MTGATILPFRPPETADEAWEALCRHRAPLVGNPRLMLDREFVQTDIRLHRRFADLYLAEFAPRKNVTDLRRGR